MTAQPFTGNNRVMKNRLIIIENHELIADELKALLTQSGNFTCDTAKGLEKMSEQMHQNNYDALIIGDDILNHKNFNQYDMIAYPPAVILTQMVTKEQENSSFFPSFYLLEKPFRLNDLLDALDRMIAAVHWQFGPWHFQTDKNYLLMNNRKTNLTEKESQILNYLCRAGGKTVEREKLLQDVWGYQNNIDTHTLETHIYRLRQKIESGDVKPEILLSEKNGYRLNNLQKNHRARVSVALSHETSELL